MPVETLTYVALAERLRISPEAARTLAKRHRLPRARSNGKTMVSVDLAEIQHIPLPAQSSAGLETIASLKAKIGALQIELCKVEATATGQRADFERERERAMQLMTELLNATAETMSTTELAARLEGELTALRNWSWGHQITRNTG